MMREAARGFDRRQIPAAAVESVWHARDGWAIRRIDWPGADGGARGSLLFLPGRGDIYEKYLETLDHWHAAGWQVTAIDWRGQGGSGRLTPDGITGHIDDFAIWIADLGDFWAQWAAGRTGPLVLVGHSMGGHLALRALVEGVVRPVAAVVTAPMLGFIAGGLPTRVLLPVARVMRALGDPCRPAWTHIDAPLASPDERMDLLTHDPARYADEQWWRHARPALRSGAASWGWILAALRSLRLLERRGALEAIDLPVLVVSADRDGLVSPRAIRAAAARLPHGELMLFGPEARHEILREVDDVRERAVGAIDGFLDRAAPAATAGR